MMRYCYLLSLLGVLAINPALAQSASDSVGSHRSCQRCCCCHHAAKRPDRLAILLQIGVTTDRSGRAYGGIGIEMGDAISPRLTVGVRNWIGFSRASASNYGYEATQPALSYYSLLGSARYQLLNTRRWRVEALGGLGAGAMLLGDRDRPVGTGRGQHAATAFFSVHPLLEGGAGFTYKAGRETWLTSQLSYHYLPGTSGLGTAGEFSGWQASVGVAVPWSWRPR